MRRSRFSAGVPLPAAALALAVLTAGCLPMPGEDPRAVEGCLVLAGAEVVLQGALVRTDLVTDLALQGSGFFALRADRLRGAPTFYTREGRFTLDRDGFLVDLQELRVLGWQADGSGQLAPTPGPLQIGAAISAPRATSIVVLRGNLQADALVGPAFDPAMPHATASFSTSMTVFDARGEARGVQVFFTKVGSGRWTWDAMSDGAGLQGGFPGELTSIGEGALEFDVQGRLAAEAQSWSFYPAGGPGPQPIALVLGDPTSAGGTGLLGVTQFASPSMSSFLQQDGQGAGVLASLRIPVDGTIEGVFTNGAVRVLAQVGVALFPAPAFLAAVPGHLLAPTLASGPAQLGPPCAGVQACVVSGALETLGEEPTACVAPRP